MITQTTITDLIPQGSTNAVGRKYLITQCVAAGLIDEETKDKERVLRLLIQDARKDNVICNAGYGYFLPTKDDIAEVRHDILRKEFMAQNIFASIRQSRNLLADLEAGRIE